MQESTCHTAQLSSFSLGGTLQALVILCQLRVVALTTVGYEYLNLVSLRAHCCCCVLRAAGRAYLYPLLVQKQGDAYRCTSYDTPCSLFCWPSRRQEIIVSSSKTTCDTNRRRVTVVRHVLTVLLRHKKKHEIPHQPKHTRLKMQSFSLETLYVHSRPQQHKKALCPTCRLCNPQSSHALPHYNRHYVLVRLHRRVQIHCFSLAGGWCCSYLCLDVDARFLLYYIFM